MNVFAWLMPFLFFSNSLSLLSVKSRSINFKPKQQFLFSFFRQMSTMKSTSGPDLILTPPQAKKVPHVVYFGAVIDDVKGDVGKLDENVAIFEQGDEGDDDEEELSQYRGDNPMNPPLEKTDSYFWLRDETRKDPEVLKYLESENKYFEQQTQHLAKFQDDLYSEMLAHLKETDEDYPYKHGPFKYYSRTEKGLSYKIHARSPIEASAEEVEQVILDENQIAQGKEYSDVSALSMSPSHRLLAYGVDNNGSEIYNLRVRAIDTGEEQDLGVAMSGDVEWGDDDSILFYTKMDAEHRPYQLFVHLLHTPQQTDLCLLEEIEDNKFWMSMYKTADDRYLVVSLDSPETSEQYVIDLRMLKEELQSGQGGLQHLLRKTTTATKKKKEEGNYLMRGILQAQRWLKFEHTGSVLNAEEKEEGDSEVDNKEYSLPIRCMRPRETGVRYEVEHHDLTFYFITNKDNARNNKLVFSPVSDYFPPPSSEERRVTQVVQWKDVRAYDQCEQIEDILPFRDFVAIFGRKKGIQQLWIMDVPNPASIDGMAVWREVRFAEEAYSVWSQDNYEFDSQLLRLGYSSLVTPKQVLDYDMKEDKFIVRKQQEVPGYNPSLYESRRTLAVSRDAMGTLIPISLVYKKEPHGSSDAVRPLLLYGYGSYGVCIDPSFDFKRTALLDRGVVYAIAHVRGGGDGPLGQGVWYEEQGKYLQKMNTFVDFADCAIHLIETEKLTAADRIAAVGRSAGGLLVGAVANMFPSLFKAVVADVPFVDVTNTMSDPTIPLTVTEWEEWGNSNEEKYFAYIQSYSPYDNVKAQNYPAMFVTAGLNDPRVAYWEPAKWVAKLREYRTNPPEVPLLLKTDMSTGHFSASDRYKYIRETAVEYSFILEQICPSEVVAVALGNASLAEET